MNTLRGIFSTTALIITVIVLLINSCQRSVPGELQVALADVKQAHAPDKRVAVFNITLSRDGNRVVVSGEVDRREYHAALFEGLKGAAGDLELVDQVTTLPPDSLGDESFGIVSVSVAPMRAAPEVSAEMIDQAMLGTVVRILKKENWYYYVQNWDGYLGWLSPSFFEPIDSAGAEEWETAARVVVTGNYGVVRAAANSGSTILSDLVPGAVLKKVGESRGWVSVELPDGRTGFVSGALVMDEEHLDDLTAEPDELLAQARTFLGIPYLWGGSSAKAFDCSGFTQSVFRLNNIVLPRDASQQAQVGDTVSLANYYAALQAGDLLFFGPTGQRITHVAIYLGDLRFIHSSGNVHVNSLDSTDVLYNEYRHKTLRTARRILPD